jgi:hypothetical protein
MRGQLAMAILVVLVVTLAAGAAGAKPSNTPIDVEFTVPEGIKTGDEVTTVLRFRALKDVDQLDVSISTFKGVELLSDRKAASFTNVRKGTAPELEVRIRLTDPKSGWVGVVFETRIGQRTAGDAVTVEYGDAK